MTTCSLCGGGLDQAGVMCQACENVLTVLNRFEDIGLAFLLDPEGLSADELAFRDARVRQFADTVGLLVDRVERR